jgi:dihydroorotate dehydrogenase (NAD+) catalytic subunit
VAAALARSVFGTTFRNPVLLAAGTAGFGRELDGIVALERLGGIVSKAVSLEPRAGNPPPRVAEFAGGMLNSVGLANPGLVHVREHELPWLARRLGDTRLIVNVVGFALEEYAAVIAGLSGFDVIAAFEINLSCPNTHAGGIEFGADPAAVRRVVESCRAATALPVIAKLSPALADIAGTALIARDAGADGISVVNTIPGLLRGPDGRGNPRLGQGNGGVSGPALLPVGVLATARVAERTGLPVIGVGGIRSAADVRQYLSAGASLVAIGTAALADPRLPERVVADLEREGD